MSDTPRTDAAEQLFKGTDYAGVVDSEHARTLERELADAEREIRAKAKAVADFDALNRENHELTAKLADAERKADEEMLRVKACEHIAEGEEGWEKLANECPSTAAVATLRAKLDEATRAASYNLAMQESANAERDRLAGLLASLETLQKNTLANVKFYEDINKELRAELAAETANTEVHRLALEEVRAEISKVASAAFETEKQNKDLRAKLADAEMELHRTWKSLGIEGTVNRLAAERDEARRNLETIHDTLYPNFDRSKHAHLTNETNCILEGIRDIHRNLNTARETIERLLDPTYLHALGSDEDSEQSEVYCAQQQARAALATISAATKEDK